jgi:hypothetical protein
MYFELLREEEELFPYPFPVGATQRTPNFYAIVFHHLALASSPK